MLFRAVLVGCGAMSEGWLIALKQHPRLAQAVSIVGLVDLQPELARGRAEQFGLTNAAVGSSFEEMLTELRPDVVLDVVVPSARQAIVRTALEHGCHVLSEKPMATSLTDAHALLSLAERAGRVHAVVQNRRFVSGVRRIRAMIESGVLGELTGLHCDFFVGAHFGGFREEMDNVLLIDMAIHTIDAARYMSQKNPLSVYCQQSNPRGSWYRHGAAANAIFELSDDVVFTYRGSWAAEGGRTSWESTWRIIGSKGTVLWDGEESFKAEIVVGGSGFFRDLETVAVPPAADPEQTLGHTSVLLDFIDAIETGRGPETANTDNIKSLAMVFSAIESARTQQRVHISQ